VAALFFDWFALGEAVFPIKFSGVFWILPLVGVRRCLSRVVRSLVNLPSNQ